MKNLKTLKDIFSKFMSLLNDQQRKRCLILFFAMLVSAVLETVGISAIIPFVNAVLEPSQLLSMHVIGNVLVMLNITEPLNIIVFAALFVIIVYLVKNIYLCVYAYYKNSFEKSLQKELSCNSFRYYLSRPYSYFLNVNSAEIIRGVESDIQKVTDLYGYINGLVSESLTILMITVFLVMTDWIMALGVLGICGISFMLISTLFKRFVRGYGEKQRQAEYDLNKCAYQAVNGIKEINVSRKMGLFIDKYDESYEIKKNITVKTSFLGALPNRIIELICVSSMMILICVRIGVSGLDNNVTFISNLSAFALAAFKLMPSIGSLVTKINAVSICRPSLNACYKNKKESEEYIGEQKQIAKNADKFTNEYFNEISIDNIGWTYPGTAKKVLSDLSMDIKRGESIGIMGESGAGKTTLSDIVLGLYVPQEGHVCVDGMDIFTIPGKWAEMIGYVPQSVFLLDDTIRNNVLFGEKAEDDEKIWDALDRAKLKEFVDNLPLKLDTTVGERGVKFSGGQRQRVAIARALYNRPQLLVLDEATSALDNETETAVMESIEALQGHITMIIIAHRLSTIQKCDEIYEIQDGKAVKRNPDTLF